MRIQLDRTNQSNNHRLFVVLSKPRDCRSNWSSFPLNVSPNGQNGFWPRPDRFFDCTTIVPGVQPILPIPPQPLHSSATVSGDAIDPSASNSKHMYILYLPPLPPILAISSDMDRMMHSIAQAPDTAVPRRSHVQYTKGHTACRLDDAQVAAAAREPFRPCMSRS